MNEVIVMYLQGHLCTLVVFTLVSWVGGGGGGEAGKGGCGGWAPAPWPFMCKSTLLSVFWRVYVHVCAGLPVAHLIIIIIMIEKNKRTIEDNLVEWPLPVTWWFFTWRNAFAPYCGVGTATLRQQVWERHKTWVLKYKSTICSSITCTLLGVI